MLRGGRVSQHQCISVDLRPFESVLQEHKEMGGGGKRLADCCVQGSLLFQVEKNTITPGG